MSYILPEIFGSGVFNTCERLKYQDWDISIPTPLRKVQEYELDLFLEDGGISVINGERHEIKKGCILLASPGDKRQSFLHFKALFMHFGVCDRTVADIIASIPRFSVEYDFEKYFALFSAVCDVDKVSDGCSDILAQARLIDVICNLKRDAASEIRQSNADFDRPDIRKAVEYINTHFFEPLSADVLAKICNLSTSHFYKIFTQITDSSPNEFIVKTRLSAAEKLLNSTDLPIVEVATRCGFNSQSYFSFCFKTEFGITPKEYRKKHFYKV